MIHVCTVHWHDDRWIKIQMNYLRRFIDAPFRVYAFCTGISNEHDKDFFFCSREDIESHQIKLNILALRAWDSRESDDDWIIFLDGDAFPIGSVFVYGRKKLGDYPLIAVRQDENMGDIQPHPSFCLTTLRFWRSIEGDWDMGKLWRISDGRLRTDVGARLFEKLEKGGHTWHPILRSNKVDLHPLYFGIYDDLVYHHGCGFRPVFSTVDTQYLPTLWRFYHRHKRRLPRSINSRINYKSRIERRNRKLSDKVFERIRADDEFHKLFMKSKERETLAAELGIDMTWLPPPLKRY
jgi:hypothetical protein